LSRATSTVWLLGLTQIIGFGAVYYCFAILAKNISQDFGWTHAQFFGCISAGLAAGGLVTPFIGKAFDRFGAARLMAFGSVLLSAALLATALAPSGMWFGVAFVIANIVSTLVLYDAAFTSLVQLSPLDGSRRIAYLTLIAGFASTLFWPLTTQLNVSLGWRETLEIYALFNVLVCAPAHYVLWRWSQQVDASDRIVAANSNEKIGSLRPEHFGMATALLTTGFVMSSVALSAVLVQMVPLFQALGFGASSLWVATLFGPAQVVVRFTNLIMGSKRHPLTVTILATILMPLGLFIVSATAPLLVGAVACVIFVGMSSGLKSIVQGTLPLALFGSRGYGARLGFMASFRYVAAALAPFGFAFVSDQSGPAMACLVFGAIGAIGLASFLWLGWLLKRWQGGAVMA
jgi:predicted MFS family arabinose efflux permease